MKLFLLPLLLIIQSCSSGLFTQRSFIQEMEYEESFLEPGRDFRVLGGDPANAYKNRRSMMKRIPSSSHEKKEFLHEITLEEELAALENKLDENEFRHYQNYKDNLESNSEKIYFLKLSGITERDHYLESLGVVDPAYKPLREEVQFAIETREIVVGMSKTDVRNSWGSPMKIDVAGNPRYENERWIFYESGRLKEIYFESGQVQGWSIK